MQRRELEVGEDYLAVKKFAGSPRVTLTGKPSSGPLTIVDAAGTTHEVTARGLRCTWAEHAARLGAHEHRRALIKTLNRTLAAEGHKLRFTAPSKQGSTTLRGPYTPGCLDRLIADGSWNVHLEIHGDRHGSARGRGRSTMLPVATVRQILSRSDELLRRPQIPDGFVHGRDERRLDDGRFLPADYVAIMPAAWIDDLLRPVDRDTPIPISIPCSVDGARALMSPGGRNTDDDVDVELADALLG